MYPGSRSSLFIVYFRRVHPGFLVQVLVGGIFHFCFFCCCSFWRRCKRDWRGWKNKNLELQYFCSDGFSFFAEPKTKNSFTKVAGSHDGSVDLSTGGGFFYFFASSQRRTKIKQVMGGCLAQRLYTRFSLSSLGLNSLLSQEFFSWCCWDLLTALLRTVSRGLMMSIKPIGY